MTGISYVYMGVLIEYTVQIIYNITTSIAGLDIPSAGFCDARFTSGRTRCVGVPLN